MPRTIFDQAARVKADPVWELIHARAATQGVSMEELARMSKTWQKSSMYAKMNERTTRKWPLEAVLNICSGLRIPVEELREKLRY